MLETFKIRRAQLLAEEERVREAMSHRDSHVGGSLTTFRLGQYGHRQTQQPSMPDSSTVAHNSPAEKRDSETDQSWVQWIGSWIGWK